MFEWIDEVDRLITDMQLLMDDIDSFLNFSTYYVYFSAVVLIVLLVIGIAILSKQGYIIRQNEYMIQMIEARKKREGATEDE